MSKIISPLIKSISTPNATISCFRSFRLISLVFFSLLVVISCGDTSTPREEVAEPATSIMDTAGANVNHVQRNYYFLVNVTANETDKLKLVVKESSEPAPTAAEIRAGAGQTKTLGTTAKTVLFAYPIGSTIGSYSTFDFGLYPDSTTRDVDGLFLKPNTEYTIYATSPDESGNVLTGGKYTTDAFNSSSPLMDLSPTAITGLNLGIYDESFFTSTLSYHHDDPLFVLPLVFARLSTDTKRLNLNLYENGILRRVWDINSIPNGPIPGRYLLPSLYYSTSRTIPYQTDMGTATSAQQVGSFLFFFYNPSASGSTWTGEIEYDSQLAVTLPNPPTIIIEQ